MSASTAIKQLLEEKGMSQTDLATAIGTTRQNLANKMSRDNFSAKELCSIGKILGVELKFTSKDKKEYTIRYED